MTDTDGLLNSTLTNVTIDNTGPTATLDLPAGFANISANSTKINASAVDVASSVDTLIFEYRINYSQSFITICQNSSSPYQCLWGISQLPEGRLYEVRARANDSRGNFGSYDTHLNITVNRTGPVATLQLPRNFENISSSTFTVNATIQEIFTPTSTVTFEYRENDTASFKFACSDNDGASLYNCSWGTSSLGDGNTYEVRMHANDTSGNDGAYSTHTNITLDKTGPSISLQAPANDTFNTTTITFYYSASDSLRAVANCSLIINGTINQTNLSITEDAQQNFTVSGFKEGDYLWNVNCSDDLGNTNNSQYRLLKVDATGPAATVDLPRTFENITSGIFKVNATAIDAGIGVSSVSFDYRRNHTLGWTNICSNTSVPYQCAWDTSGLTEGIDYQVRASATDIFGNVGGFSNNTNITVDMTPPVVQLRGPPNNTQYVAGTQVLFEYNTTDSLLGIANCSLVINNTINQTNTSLSKNDMHNFTLSTLNDGNYSWTVLCYDFAGNSNSSLNRTIRIAPDTGPPIINLASPDNASTSSINDITFSYNVSDALSGIAACSLLINGSFNQSNSTAIAENDINSFTIPDLPDGEYRWAVNCTDTAATPNTWLTGNFTLFMQEATSINVTVSLDAQQYESTNLGGETANITLNTTDKFRNALHTNVTTSVIEGNTSVPWWNESYKYRQQLNLTNRYNGVMEGNFTINVTLDTSTLISAGKMQADADDLRVAFFNNDTNTLAQLDRMLFDVNTAQTSVLFRTQRNISANEAELGYFIYYGNSTVANPPGNKSLVYFYYDGFGINTLASYNTTKAFDNAVEDADDTLSHNSSSGTIHYEGLKDNGKSIRYTALSIKDLEIEVQQNVDYLPGEPPALRADFELGARVNGESYYFMNIPTQNFFDAELGRYNSGVRNQTLSATLDNYALDTYWSLKFIVYDINTSTVGVRAFIGNSEVMAYNDSGVYRITDSGGFGTGSIQFVGDWSNLTVKRYVPVLPSTVLQNEQRLAKYQRIQTATNGVAYITFNSTNQTHGNYSAVSIAERPPWYANGLGFRLFEVVIDTTVPYANLTAPLNNSWNNTGSINFTYIPTDNAYFVNNCTLIIDGLNNRTDNSARYGIVNNFTVTGLNEGFRQWSVVCTDNGNNSNSPQGRQVNIDKTVPQPSINYPVDNFNTTSYVFDYNFTATDNMAPNLSCSITLDNSARFTNASLSSNLTNNASIQATGPGPHQWNVTCTDLAFNSQTTALRNFTIVTGPRNIIPLLSSDGISVNLSWPAVDDAVSYHIFISTNYSNFSSVPDVTGITDLNWTDAEANSSTRKFYRVMATSRNLNATSVLTAGKFEAPIDENWNLVSMPLNLSILALGDESTAGNPLVVTPADSLVALWRWNATSQGFQKSDHIADYGWSPASGSESFTALEADRGYWIEANASRCAGFNCTVTFVGLVPIINNTISLAAEWNIVSWDSLNEPTLGQESIYGTPLPVIPNNSIYRIYRYNSSTDQWEKTDHYDDWGWDPASGASAKFTTLQPDRGYYFRLNQSAAWGHTQ